MIFQDGDSEGDSGFVTPDSTTGGNNGRRPSVATKRQDLRVGEEVLSHGKDGCFYLGNIVEVGALMW